MNKFYILILVLFLSGSVSFAASYFNDDIPQGAGNLSTGQIHSINQVSRIGNTYYTPSGVSYTRQDNQIYGSDGSSYSHFGNIIQNNSTGKMYQINNNLIQELR